MLVARKLDLKRFSEIGGFARQDNGSGGLVDLCNRESVGRGELANLLNICWIGAVVGSELFAGDALAAGHNLVERGLLASCGARAAAST